MKHIFDTSECSTHDKLHNFTKYVRRQDIARFLCQTEIFKKQINLKGSIVECGVHQGGSIMTWGHLTATLEPYNYHRKIIGFDTFEGFPSIHKSDGDTENVRVGNFSEDFDTYEELMKCIELYDNNRFLNDQNKIQLIKGDALKTIPEYVKNNKHLIVSLLYLDFDLYEPTVAALRSLLPRIPKGGIIVFDEVNNKEWPGETLALIDEMGLNNNRLECFDFEPNISFIQID